MTRIHLSPIAAVLLTFLAPAAAQATQYFAVSAGVFNVTRALQNESGQDTPVQLGLEYRGEEFYYGLAPMGGIYVNSDQGGYAYAGLNWNIPVGAGFVLTPNFAAGLYARGDGHDMGGPIEFRSGIEITTGGMPGTRWEKDRFGFAFNHISNASIYDRNPGAESLMFIYASGF